MKQIFGVAIGAIVFWQFAAQSWAGPQDLSTNFPVTIEVGGFKGGGIADSGGTTTISFVDAQAAGLVDQNGDPTKTPDGTGSAGGAGGGGYRYNQFNNV